MSKLPPLFVPARINPDDQRAQENGKTLPASGNLFPRPSADLGLRHDQINEARQFRDAEDAARLPAFPPSHGRR